MSPRRWPRSGRHLSRTTPGRPWPSSPWPPPPATAERAPGLASEREGLRPAVHLGAAALGHRLDRRAGKRVVGGEQPPQRLRLVEPAVEEHRERAVQALDDLIAVKERSRYAQRAVGALHRDQLAVAEQLPDPARREAKPVSHVREGHRVADEPGGLGVNLRHSPKDPRRALSQTRQQPFTGTSPA